MGFGDTPQRQNRHMSGGEPRIDRRGGPWPIDRRLLDCHSILRHRNDEAIAGGIRRQENPRAADAVEQRDRRSCWPDLFQRGRES